MTTRDKWGAGILIFLFIALGIVLYYSIPRAGRPIGSPEESFFIRQRIINIEKSR